MFSPALVRYILDPDSTLKTEENKKITLEKHVFKANILDFDKIKKDYGFFQDLISKIGLVFKQNKNLSESKQK